jgi:chemotaxis protein histidine kinase CheA
VRDILVQLARNAVTHGIEAPLERVRQGKDPVGTIQLSFVYQKDRYYQLLLHDDGRGIDASCIRKAALRSGKWNTQQLSARDDSQVLQLLFEPGFSTSEHISTHAGRGIGLEIVKKKLTQLSAELQLATRPGEFCEWRLMVSLLPSKQAGANAARHA